MKTFSAKPQEVTRQWQVVDASGLVLGRLATEIARRLRGKHKPVYTPHVDTGDYIIVINAKNIDITGRKEDNKLYHHHTGFPGGIKTRTFREIRDNKPEEVIMKAVKGMMPRNALGRQMLSKLKIYAGSEHAHQAQQPVELKIK